MTRVALTDRPWLAYRGGLSIGPISAPAPDEIRACLTVLADAFPRNPLVCRLDVARRQWCPVPRRHLDSHLRGVVVGDSDIDAVSLADRLPLWLANFDPALPLSIRLSPRAFTMLSSHALGDARTSFAIIERLLRSVRDPDGILDLARLTSNRSTLRAMVDFYGHRPQRVIETLRSPRPAPRSSSRAGGPTDPATVPARIRLVYGRLDQDRWSAIRAWRDQRAPGVSVASVLFSLTCQAFASTGLPMDTSGFYVLVDNRRYLSGSAPSWGNLAKSIYVRPGDLGDPVAIHHTIRTAVDSGRALASTALSAGTFEWRRRRHRRAGVSPTAAGGDDVVFSLTYSNQMESLDLLPWLSGDRWLGGAGTTGSPSGITVYFANMHGELHISIMFVPGLVDEPDVRRALTLLQSGSLGALGRPPVSSH